MRIFSRILNLPPASDAEGIHDKTGKKYWLKFDSQEKCSRIDVWYRAEIIGRVDLDWRENRVVLADIIIHEIKFRQHGLGTIVLQRAISLAKRQGASEILGFVAKNDVAENPKLLDWYRQNGFDITLVEDDHWVAQIQMHL